MPIWCDSQPNFGFDKEICGQNKVREASDFVYYSIAFHEFRIKTSKIPCTSSYNITSNVCIFQFLWVENIKVINVRYIIVTSVACCSKEDNQAPSTFSDPFKNTTTENTIWLKIHIQLKNFEHNLQAGFNCNKNQLHTYTVNYKWVCDRAQTHRHVKKMQIKITLSIKLNI